MKIGEANYAIYLIVSTQYRFTVMEDNRYIGIPDIRVQFSKS